MRITAVDVAPLRLQKDDPTWRFALGGTPASEGFLVRVAADDGLAGFGTCAAATYYGVTLGGLRDALDLFRPRLLGRDPLELEPILVDLDGALARNERARAAVEIALHDLAARALGIPLATLLGGPLRRSAPVIRILALKAPDEVASQAARLVDEGFRWLKIKLEGDVDVDVARVRAVRGQVGPDVHLTADANQTYSVKSAIRALRVMERDGLELIEQPVHAADLAGLREVRRAVTVAVEADESANTLDEIARLVHERAVDSVNLKISHVGGIRRARIAAGICEAGDVRCRMGGGTVGSQLLAAASLHVLASTPGLVDPSEVAEWMRLSGDPASGLVVGRGEIALPTGPGLGLEVDEASLPLRP